MVNQIQSQLRHLLNTKGTTIGAWSSTVCKIVITAAMHSPKSILTNGKRQAHKKITWTRFVLAMEMRKQMANAESCMPMTHLSKTSAVSGYQNSISKWQATKVVTAPNKPVKHQVVHPTPKSAWLDCFNINCIKTVSNSSHNVYAKHRDWKPTLQVWTYLRQT